MNSTSVVPIDPSTQSPFSDALLKEIRSRFHHVEECPYSGNRVYLENAGGSLTLKSVIETTAKIGAIPDNEHRDNPASVALSKIVHEGLNQLSVFFGSESGVIFGGETGTECLFRLIRSAALAAPEGGCILASAAEHPSTYSATQIWAKNTNREWREVAFDTQSGIVGAEDYSRQVTPDTRVATVIHTNPVTGIVMDVKSIVAAIKAVSPECFVIIDGIQHAPHGYLEVEEYGADAYVISLYKVYSKFNNGYAWVSDRLSRIPHEALLGKPDSAWELGSRDPSALSAASEVVRYLCWLGQQFTSDPSPREQLKYAGKAMLAHEHQLIELILHGNDAQKGLYQMIGIKVLGTEDISRREGAVSFGVEGYEATDIVADLNAHGIRTHSRMNDLYSGNVLRPLGLNSVARVSLAHYNSQEEILLFLGTLERLLVER